MRTEDSAITKRLFVGGSLHGQWLAIEGVWAMVPASPSSSGAVADEYVRRPFLIKGEVVYAYVETKSKLTEELTAEAVELLSKGCPSVNSEQTGGRGKRVHS